MSRKNKSQETQDKEDQQYLDQLFKTFEYSSEQFDKSILFVSSGALGLSISFLDKLIRLETASFKFLLVISWGAFAVTIFLFTIAHYISVRAAKEAVRNYHLDKANGEEKVRDRWVRYSNQMMIGTLFMGLITLIIFIFLNLQHHEQKYQPREIAKQQQEQIKQQ